MITEEIQNKVCIEMDKRIRYYSKLQRQLYDLYNQILKLKDKAVNCDNIDELLDYIDHNLTGMNGLMISDNTLDIFKNKLIKDIKKLDPNKTKVEQLKLF